jgi:hypothetical protein
MTPQPKHFVLTILAALLLTAVSFNPACADPWAGRWYHPVKHWQHDDDEDEDEDEDHGRAYRAYDGGGYDNGFYYGGVCGDVMGRIDNDRMSINKIVPTGRHRKALRWYQEDLQKAERDLYVCRQGGRSAGRYYGNDPYAYGSYGSYGDPYAGPYTGRLKDDWPYLLETLLLGQVR